MPRCATGHDDETARAEQLVLVVDDGGKRHVVRVHVDTPAHAVAQAIRLFENLFKHKERVSAFLQLPEIDVHRLHGGVHPRVVHVHHLQLVPRTNDGDVAVFQVNHLVGIFHDGRRVRSQVEIMFMPDAHHQRAALARGNDLLGMTFVEDGNGVCPDYLVQRDLHGPQQVQAIAHLDIFNKLHQHLRVRLAAELHPALHQPLLQRGIVLDDAVVDQSQVARSGIMRMGVGRTGFAMRGPPGMRDAHVPADILRLHGTLQVCHFAFGLIHVQLARVADERHPRTVITTIFQTLQPLYQYGISFLFSYITDNSTHVNFFFFC